MREKDYILVTNKSDVRMAIEAVRDILPDGETITEDEYKILLGTLGKWQDKIFRKMDKK